MNMKVFEIYFMLMKKIGCDSAQFATSRQVLLNLSAVDQEGLVNGQTPTPEVIANVSRHQSISLKQCEDAIHNFILWRTRKGLSIETGE